MGTIRRSDGNVHVCGRGIGPGLGMQLEGPLRLRWVHDHLGAPLLQPAWPFLDGERYLHGIPALSMPAGFGIMHVGGCGSAAVPFGGFQLL